MKKIISLPAVFGFVLGIVLVAMYAFAPIAHADGATCNRSNSSSGSGGRVATPSHAQNMVNSVLSRLRM